MQYVHDVNLLATVLKNISIPMGIALKSGKILFFNKAFTHAFGYTTEDIPTARDFKKQLFISQTYAQEQYMLWKKQVREASQTNNYEATKIECEFQCKDGTMKVANTFTTITDELFIITIEDITKERMKPAHHNGVHLPQDPVSGCLSLKAMLINHRILDRGEHLIFFDLDKLRAYEENEGKVKALGIIKRFAHFLEDNTREETHFYRYDNNTFATIIKTSEEGLHAFIERINNEWHKMGVTQYYEKKFTFCTGTVSITKETSLEKAVLKATEALQKAQWKGPNSSYFLAV